jgi:hypothetical protein
MADIAQNILRFVQLRAVRVALAFCSLTSSRLELPELVANLQKPIYPFTDVEKLTESIFKARFRGKPVLVTKNRKDIAKLAYAFALRLYSCSSLKTDEVVRLNRILTLQT